MKIPKQALLCEKEEKIQCSQVFKEYIQAYLHWSFEQNPKFHENLNTVELTNFFMKEFDHPLWFRIFVNESRFIALVTINAYLERYAADAYIFDSDIILYPKRQNVYTPLSGKQDLVPASEEEKKQITIGCLRNHFPLKQHDLNNLSHQQARYALAFLQQEEGGSGCLN